MDDNQVSFSAHPQGELQKCDGDRELIERGKAVAHAYFKATAARAGGDMMAVAH